jgi:hypothetical protein
LPRNSLLILWPALGQVGWTFLLYAWLTVARSTAVKRGEVKYGSFAFNRDEPKDVARIRLNLANQFELPLFFFFAVAILIALNRVNGIDIAAAWVFVGGRVVHSLAQGLTDNVPLRGQVFLINFTAACVLLGHLALIALEAL